MTLLFYTVLDSNIRISDRLRFLFAAKVFQRRFLREWIQARHVTPTLAVFGAHWSLQAEGFRQAEIPKIAPSVVVAAACDVKLLIRQRWPVFSVQFAFPRISSRSAARGAVAGTRIFTRSSCLDAGVRQARRRQGPIESV